MLNTKFVFPSIQELCSVKTNVSCTQEGCGKTFTNTGALNVHLIKSHRLVKSDNDLRLFHKRKVEEILTVHYYCPVARCKYNGGTLSFSTFTNIKAHYVKVHAEKKYVCRDCNSAFGLERDMQRHAQKCGVMYSCGSCSVKYTTKEALLMHCKRVSHVYPEEYKRQKKQKKTTAVKPAQPVVTPLPNLVPVVLIGVQPTVPIKPPRPLLPAPQANQDSDCSTMPVASLVTKTKEINHAAQTVSHSNIVTPFLHHPKADALIQTDIYGVNTLAVSTKDKTDQSVNQVNPSNSIYSTQSISPPKRNLKKPLKKQLPLKRKLNQVKDTNYSLPRRKKMKSSTGMQTSVSFTRKKGPRNVTSTQTTGDFILETAMKQANIQIQKKTVASQVTPHKGLSMREHEFKSSEMQTFISGFKPQFVDSSSQVQNTVAECETMTDLPLSASTQTIQSFLESQQEKLSTSDHPGNDLHKEVYDNVLYPSPMKSKATRMTDVVRIFDEHLDSSVSFEMPESVKRTSNRKQPVSNEAHTSTVAESISHSIQNSTSDINGDNSLIEVKITSDKVGFNDETVSAHTGTDSVNLSSIVGASYSKGTDDQCNIDAVTVSASKTMFDDKMEVDYLASEGHTTDMEAQTMSASEFDQLLQSSGIFLNNDDFFNSNTEPGHVSTATGTSFDYTDQDCNRLERSTNLDFLNVGTSTIDMNTQTGPDLNIFDQHSTQTVDNIDFLDLVMSNMETQTLNDDDLISLGLLDNTLQVSNTQNMGIGTSDFDDLSPLKLMQHQNVLGSDSSIADPKFVDTAVGVSFGTDMSPLTTDYFLENVTGSMSDCSDSTTHHSNHKQASTDTMCDFENQTNQSGVKLLGACDQKLKVQTETQTATSDLGEDMLVLQTETQTQVESTDTGFVAINMETQTCFEDLQDFCDMLQ